MVLHTRSVRFADDIKKKGGEKKKEMGKKEKEKGNWIRFELKWLATKSRVLIRRELARAASFRNRSYRTRELRDTRFPHESTKYNNNRPGRPVK